MVSSSVCTTQYLSQGQGSCALIAEDSLMQTFKHSQICTSIQFSKEPLSAQGSRVPWEVSG